MSQWLSEFNPQRSTPAIESIVPYFRCVTGSDYRDSSPTHAYIYFQFSDLQTSWKNLFQYGTTYWKWNTDKWIDGHSVVQMRRMHSCRPRKNQDKFSQRNTSKYALLQTLRIKWDFINSFCIALFQICTKCDHNVLLRCVWSVSKFSISLTN
jgi:hypothetical protein